MYVCVCLAVTEAEVEAAIAALAALPPGGACTREAVTSACRAGGDCGACHGMIESKIEDHLEGVDGAAAASGVRPTGDRREESSAPQLISADALVRHRAA